MHIKKYFAIIAIFVLSACSHDDVYESSTQEKVMWNAAPIAVINDRSVQLNWQNGTIRDDMLRLYELVNPDEFDIFISEDNKAFHKLKTVKNDEQGTKNTEIIKNLQNGKPYFFYLVSKNKKFLPLTSNKIMAIPNKKKENTCLLTSEGIHTMRDISISPDQKKIAYVDIFHTWDEGRYGAASIFISNIDGSRKELLDINCYKPFWSPDGKKITFQTEKTEVSHEYGMPSQIALYNTDTKIITKLTEGLYFNYAPVFSKNGKSILFHSNKNSSGKYNSTIWLKDLESSNSFQVIDNSTLVDATFPYWVDNNKFLFQGIYPDGKWQIYESTVTDKKIANVFQSEWDDFHPSISPDNKKIAFISNRSGSNEVWIYYTKNKQYRQITGYSLEDYLYSEWTNIVWLDNTTIVFTLNDQLIIKQIIE
jgi:TolB protein